MLRVQVFGGADPIETGDLIVDADGDDIGTVTDVAPKWIPHDEFPEYSGMLATIDTGTDHQLVRPASRIARCDACGAAVLLPGRYFEPAGQSRLPIDACPVCGDGGDE